MSWKRVTGALLLLLGGLACYFGTEGLSKDLSEAGRSASLIPFEGGAILVGLGMMIVGAILFARSFLEL